MIVALKPGVTQESREQLMGWLQNLGLHIHVSEGEYQTILGLVGDTTKVDMDLVASLDIVDSVKRVTEPFKCCNRKFHPEDTVVEVGDVKIGGGNFCVMAGPCSVESEEQIVAVAKAVKASGANMLRGGAFKPRTSPYTFQGLEKTGVDLLVQAGRTAGLPVVTEITDISQLDLLADVDVLQVGARNMQNYTLLKALGQLRRPVLLKRGLSATVEEFLLAAEYLLSGGNEQVILCERGVRSGVSAARAALDVSAIPVLKRATHLPVLVDPSHAAGRSELVLPLALAAAAAGADGLMVEVHDRPACALSDGGQSLTCRQFRELSAAVTALLPYAWRPDTF